MRWKPSLAWRAAVLALAVAGSCPGAGVAQQVTSVPAKMACPACKIRLQRVVTLDAGSSFGGLRQGSQIARSSGGTYYAAPTHDPGKIAVFDARGRYLRSFGERGLGPGELPEVRRIFVGPGDSVFVAGRGAEVNVFDPAARFVRSFPTPDRPNDLLWGGRQLLVSAEPEAMRSEPVQLLTTEGNPVRFVTDEEWALLCPLPFELFRGPGGTFWTAQSDGREYRLGLSRQDGRQLRAFRRSLTTLGADGLWRWLPERFTRGRGPGNPMSPRLKDFAVDASGRLWVLLLRENDEWLRRVEEKWKTPPGAEGTPRKLGVEDSRQRYDRFLEVFDPAAGHIVVRARVPHLVGGFLDSSHLYTYREANGGAVVVDVWRMRVARS